jgi:hypothetical protein
MITQIYINFLKIDCLLPGIISIVCKINPKTGAVIILTAGVDQHKKTGKYER